MEKKQPYWQRHQPNNNTSSMYDFPNKNNPPSFAIYIFIIIKVLKEEEEEEKNDKNKCIFCFETNNAK